MEIPPISSRSASQPERTSPSSGLVHLIKRVAKLIKKAVSTTTVEKPLSSRSVSTNKPPK